MMEMGYNHQDQHEAADEQEEYQVQNTFRKIEELENFGINKTDIIKQCSKGNNNLTDCFVVELLT